MSEASGSSGSSRGREQEASDRKLKRELSLQQLFFISLGSIIGSGWLFAAISASGIAGPSSIFSWIIGTVLIILIALNYAEVSVMLPRSGAVVRYPHLSHGGYLGFLMGWAFLLATVTVTAIEAQAATQYIAGFPGIGLELTTTAEGATILTGLGLLIAFLFMIVFFFLNFFGVKFFGTVNQWISWWKLFIPVITFILLFFAFKASNFTAGGGFVPEGIGPVFNAIPAAGIAFSFFGFRQGLDFGGEAQDPQRDIPRATIASVVVAGIIYILLQIGFLGAINWQDAGINVGDWTALGTSNWGDSPLTSALQGTGIVLLGYFAFVLFFDAIISPGGTGIIYMGASTRVFYGMSMNRDLPRPLTWVSDRTGIPWVSLLASLIIGAFFLIPYSGWALLVNFITDATVFTFIMGALQLQVMRRTAPDLPRPFYLKGAWLLSPLGFLAGSMIFYWAAFENLKGVIAAILIGLPIYVFVQAPARGKMSRAAGLAIGIPYLVIWAATQYFGPLAADSLPFLLYWLLCAIEVVGFTLAVYALSNAEGKREVGAAWWIIFLTLALYLLSYYGSYGDLENALIPFPWDNLVAIVIGLIAYFWGVRSGYQTEEMKELNDSGVGVIVSEEEEREAAASGGSGRLAEET